MIQLGPFHLRERIGQGGMGEVWAATHARGGEPVAVKILSAEGLRDVVYRSAFRNEVRAVSALRHPHIVKVFEHGEVDAAEARQAPGLVAGMSYLVMEMASGGSLAPRRGRLSWAELRAVLLAMLDALAHAHARGVIHRDLKPGNILLGRTRPAIKLTDFGLAHAVDRTFPWQASSTAGTPAYMAPEQFVGEWRDFGPWTDLYALGCVAWSLACGHPPFQSSGRDDAMDAHLGDAPRALDPKMTVPEGFEGWLRALLEKDLKYRPQSAAEAAWSLRGLPAVESEPAKLRRDRPARWLPVAARIVTLGWETPMVSPVRGGGLPLPLDWREAAVDEPPGLVLSGTGLGLFGMRAVPFVGREAERDALWRALRRVWEDGRPGVVLLRGQPGCGKSRLARWVEQRVAELGVATPLRATHGPSTPGWAGIERMMARWFKSVGLPEEEARYRVRVALSAWGEPIQSEVEAYTAAMVGDAAEGGTPREPGSARRRAVLRRFLERLARERPAVVVLEDVQWGVEPLEFVRELLADGVRAPPVLFVLTWRDDFVGLEESAALIETIRRDPRAVDLPVGPLSETETLRLVDGLAGLEPSLAAEVVQRCEGMPLFAVQLVTDWVDRGALVAGASGYRLADGFERRLPDDLHQMWVERLDRLLEGRDPKERTALEVAAALGVEVDLAEWREVCSVLRIPAPDDLVELLIDHHLGQRATAGDRWAFAHGMLRETLERGARDGRRARGQHRACVKVLERRGGRVIHERLGRHLLAAGRADAAVTLLLTAASGAIARADGTTADRLLGEVERAIAAAALPVTDPRRAETWLARSRVETARGAHTQATRWARIADAVATQFEWGGLRSRANAQLAWSFHVLGHPEEALDFGRQAVALAEGVADDDALSESLSRLAEVLRVGGRLPEAIAAYQRALGLYRGKGSGAARCLIGLAAIARIGGDLDGARARVVRARALYEEQGDARGVASALTNLSDVARHQGEVARAIALAEEALARVERDDPTQATLARLNLALALIAAGRDSEAKEPLRHCIVELHRQGWRALVAVARLALLRGCAREGDWEAWDRHLTSSTELLDHVGARDPDIPWLLAIAAEAAREAGDAERGAVASRRADAERVALAGAEAPIAISHDTR